MLLALGPARAGDDNGALLAGLVAAGEPLLARESALAQNAPGREAEVDEMIVAAGTRWMSDEHAFQDGLDRLLDRYRDLTPDVREGVINLIRLNNEMVNGMTALNLCNKAEAIWEFAVASQFLDHARDDLRGRVDPGWAPDRRLDPKAPGGCR